jgi:Protein of unknown function (DUF3800)
VKFCYVDESGKGEEPILVLTGIVADAYRMHVTKADWLEILAELSQILNRPIEEFHTHQFYRGNSIWRRLNGEERTAMLDRILEWLTERNLHQREARNKGHTVIIFDQGRGAGEVAEIVLKPPPWSDSFYEYERLIRRRHRELPNPEQPLSMIVDVPYFADSRHVGMLQIADLFAYLLRRYAELRAGLRNEEYSGEADKVARWVSQIACQLVPDVYRWRTTRRCECSNFFRDIAEQRFPCRTAKPNG